MGKALIGEFIDYHANATNKHCFICCRKFREGEQRIHVAGKWIDDAPCYSLPAEQDFDFYVGADCFKRHVPEEAVIKKGD